MFRVRREVVSAAGEGEWVPPGGAAVQPRGGRWTCRCLQQALAKQPSARRHHRAVERGGFIAMLPVGTPEAMASAKRVADHLSGAYACLERGKTVHPSLEVSVGSSGKPTWRSAGADAAARTRLLDRRVSGADHRIFRSAIFAQAADSSPCRSEMPEIVCPTYVSESGSTSMTNAVAPHLRSRANPRIRWSSSFSAVRLAALIRNW